MEGVESSDEKVRRALARMRVLCTSIQGDFGPPSTATSTTSTTTTTTSTAGPPPPPTPPDSNNAQQKQQKEAVPPQRELLAGLQTLVSTYTAKVDEARRCSNSLAEREQALARREADIAQRQKELVEREQFASKNLRAHRDLLRRRDRELRQREAAVMELRGLRSPAMLMDESAAEQLALQRQALGTTLARVHRKLRAATEKERRLDAALAAHSRPLDMLSRVLCSPAPRDVVLCGTPLLLEAPPSAQGGHSVEEALAQLESAEPTDAAPSPLLVVAARDAVRRAPRLRSDCRCLDYPLCGLLEGHTWRRSQRVRGRLRCACPRHAPEHTLAEHVAAEARQAEAEAAGAQPGPPRPTCLRLQGLMFTAAELQYLLQPGGGVLAIVEHAPEGAGAPSLYVWARSELEGHAMKSTLEATQGTTTTGRVVVETIDPRQFPEGPAGLSDSDGVHVSAVLLSGLVAPPYTGAVDAEQIYTLLSLAGRVREVYTFYPHGHVPQEDRFSAVVTYDTFSECLQAEEIFDSTHLSEGMTWRVTPCSVPVDLTIHTGYYTPSSSQPSWDLACSAPASNALMFTFCEAFSLAAPSSFTKQRGWTAETVRTALRRAQDVLSLQGVVGPGGGARAGGDDEGASQRTALHGLTTPREVAVILQALGAAVGEEGFHWRWLPEGDDDGGSACRRAVCVCRDTQSAVSALLSVKSALGASFAGSVCPVAFYSQDDDLPSLLESTRPRSVAPAPVDDISGAAVLELCEAAEGSTVVSYSLVLHTRGWAGLELTGRVLGKHAAAEGGIAGRPLPCPAGEAAGMFCTASQRGCLTFADGDSMVVLRVEAVQWVGVGTATLVGWYAKVTQDTAAFGGACALHVAVFDGPAGETRPRQLYATDTAQREAAEETYLTELLTVASTAAAVYRPLLAEQKQALLQGSQAECASDTEERLMVPKWEVEGGEDTFGDADGDDPGVALSDAYETSSSEALCSYHTPTPPHGPARTRQGIGIPSIDPMELSGLWHLTVHFEESDAAARKTQPGLLPEQEFFTPLVYRNYPMFLYLKTTEVLEEYKQATNQTPTSSLVARLRGRLRNAGPMRDHIFGEVHCYADILDDESYGCDSSPMRLPSEPYNIGYFLRLLVWHPWDCAAGIPRGRRPLFTLTAIIDPDEPTTLLSGKAKQTQGDDAGGGDDILFSEAGRDSGTLAEALLSVFSEMQVRGSDGEVDCLLEKVEFPITKHGRRMAQHDSDDSDEESSADIGPFAPWLCDPTNLKPPSCGVEMSRTKARPACASLLDMVDAAMKRVSGEQASAAAKKRNKKKRKKKNKGTPGGSKDGPHSPRADGEGEGSDPCSADRDSDTQPSDLMPWGQPVAASAMHDVADWFVAMLEQATHKEPAECHA